jgi:glycosyltransferase involved in cell wall biosynthesis
MDRSRPPEITIVTPSLNQGRFIRRTIESVLCQDGVAIEYLLFDGGSTDETLEILRQYGGRFYWVSEKDRGQAAAVNKGWRRARGKYLGWLNSDDIYLPGALAQAVAFLEARPGAAAVYGEGYHIAEDDRKIERYPTEPFDRKRLGETCFICQPTVFLRRSVVEEVGYLDESLHYAMDYDLWFRIARRYGMFYSKSDWACTRFYPGSKTLGHRLQAHREILKVVQRHTGAVPPSWVYGYAHAVMERHLDRSRGLHPLLFPAGLILISAKTFWQFNRRVPLAECRRWWTWLRGNFQWRYFFPPKGKP